MSVRAVAAATEEARATEAAIAAVRARTLTAKAVMAATAAATFGWDKLSPTTKMNKRIIELNNERVAVMGIWGLGTYEIMGVTILPGGGYLSGH